MKTRQLWQAPVVLAMGLLIAGIVSLIAMNSPSDESLRHHESVFVPGDLTHVPERFSQARRLPGAAPQSLPHDWVGSKPSVTQAWYFFPLAADARKDLSLWIPRLAMNAQVWLNGQPLALRGQLTEPVSRYWNLPWLIPLPAERLLATENLLAIHVVAERAGQGLLREIYIGPDSALRSYHNVNHFFSQQLLQLIVLLMLLSAVFMALLWWWGQRDQAYGSYAVMMLAWAIHDIYPLITSNWITPLLLDWFWHVSLVWFVFSVCVFVFRYLHRDESVFERRFLYWAMSSTVTMTLLAWLAPHLFYEWGIYINDTVTLILSGYPLLCVVLVKIRTGSADLSLMIPAGSIESVFGVHDWLMISGYWNRDSHYLMPYGSLAIMLVIGILLTRRFGVALRSLATMNQSLEQKLKEREQEIAQTHQRLLKLQTEQAILNERERLVRDMHDGLGGTLVSTLAMVKSGSLKPDTLEQALQAAIEDLRLMIDSLDPVDGDLVTVLASLRSRLTPRLSAAGLRVDWQVSSLPPVAWLSPQGVLSVMRIIQEGINNVLKHAGANVIEIACGLDEQNNQVWVRLADDGVGLGAHQPSVADETSAAEVAAISGGRGLGNMKQRAAVIGATLVFGPRAGGGTEVMLRFPAEPSDASPSARKPVPGLR